MKDAEFTVCAPCLFGVEGIAANEIRFKLGKQASCSTGRVSFAADAYDVARANLLLSTVERIQLFIGSYRALTFDELFEGARSLPWENYIPRNGAFPVTGSSLDSKLASVPDCQSILKKAVVDRLKTRYRVNWFEETGPLYKISFLLIGDNVSLYIDTSGAGLHKRGYRREGGTAPIKETLAAAIADCARVKPYSRIIDPCCGSGTLLIEAALKALKIAPGGQRGFVCEKWGQFAGVFPRAREEAKSLRTESDELSCAGYDILPEAVRLTAENAEKAGVGRYVTASLRSIADFEAPDDGRKTIVLANPPYGERLSDIRGAQQLYALMGEKFLSVPGLSAYIISSDEDFEKHFGKKADKRRKLYNGMIKCSLYMYTAGAK